MTAELEPLWGEGAELSSGGGDWYDFDTPRSGGRYRVARSAMPALKALNLNAKARLTTYIVDHNRFASDQPVMLTSDLIRDRLPKMRRLTPSQQMDRLLLYLDSTGRRPGDKIEWLGSHVQTEATIEATARASAWIEAQSSRELRGIGDLLEGEGFLRSNGRNRYISARGFERIEELRSNAAQGDQAFIAMWFAPNMDEIYINAIEPAILETGYKPMRIDRKEHNNKIDDEILAEIQRSRFLIADFTCDVVDIDEGKIAISRGGVYYEAGYAQGRGIPVIWLVREDQIGLVHFDTRQFNHIPWRDADDLRKRLVNRIRATFPEAP